MRLILALIFSASSCFASEGFYSTGAPPEVEKAYPSVLMLLIDRATSYSHATAFVVKSKNAETYLVTSNHALPDECVRDCANLKVYLNAELDNSKLGERLHAGKALSSSVEILKRDPEHDLALLSFATKVEMTPLKISESCLVDGRIYAIGFPETSDRVPTQKIENQNQTVKRWSEGLAAGKVVVQNQVLLAMTVDLLEGSSGGPIIDSNGFVVGLAKASTADPTNHFAYTGKEMPGSEDANSAAVSCRNLKLFLKLSLSLETTGY